MNMISAKSPGEQKTCYAQQVNTNKAVQEEALHLEYQKVITGDFKTDTQHHSSHKMIGMREQYPQIK